MKNNQKSYGNLIKNGIFTQLQLLGTQLFGVYKKTTYLCQQILDKSRIRRITELSHVVQERAEGPKAPSPGHLPFTYPLRAGDRWFRAYGVHPVMKGQSH